MQFWELERFRVKETADAHSTYDTTFFKIATLMCLGTLGVSVASPVVIKIMSSAEFHSASSVVPILAIGTLFSSLAWFFNFSFLARERTTWISRNNLILAALATLLYLPLIPLLGIHGAALALTGAYAIQYLLVFLTSKQVYDLGVNGLETFKLLGTTAGACAASSIINFGESFPLEVTMRMLFGLGGFIMIILISSRARSNVFAAGRHIRMLTPKTVFNFKK